MHGRIGDMITHNKGIRSRGVGHHGPSSSLLLTGKKVRAGATPHIETGTDDIVLGWRIERRALISHNADIFLFKSHVLYGEYKRRYDVTKRKSDTAKKVGHSICVLNALHQPAVGVEMQCVIYPNLGIHENQPFSAFLLLPLTTRALCFPLR